MNSITNNKLTSVSNPNSINNYLYLIRMLSVMSIVIMSFANIEQSAMHYVVATNEKSLGSLLLLTELKQLLSALSSIDIVFIEGALKNIVDSLDKAENLLFISSILTELQMLILKLSLLDIVKYAVVFFFITSFIVMFQRLSLKALLVILMLSPGLALYSNTVHFLADDLAKVIEGDLYTQLSNLTHELDKEKNTLLKKHQDSLKKIDKSHSDFKLFHRLVADVSYDFDDVKDTVEDDYTTLIRVLRGGGKAIFKETIEYFTKLIFLLFLLPLGYFYIIYGVVRYAFPGIHYGKVQLLDKLEKNIVTSNHHLLAYCKTNSSIFKGVSQWLKHTFISPVESYVQQEANKVYMDIDTIHEKVEPKIINSENTFKNQTQSLEQELRNEVQHTQQKFRNAILARVNKITQHVVQLNELLKNRINSAIINLVYEEKDECNKLMEALKNTIQRKLLVVNEELHCLMQEAEQSLQHQLKEALSHGEMALANELQRIEKRINTKVDILLQDSKQHITDYMHQLNDKATQSSNAELQKLGIDLQSALSQVENKLMNTGKELIQQLKSHAKELEEALGEKLLVKA